MDSVDLYAEEEQVHTLEWAYSVCEKYNHAGVPIQKGRRAMMSRGACAPLTGCCKDNAERRV